MKEIKVIDITPSWKSLVRPLLDAYAATNKPDVKNDIVSEFERLAETVDTLNKTNKVQS
jgi:hypothetical protein